MTNVLVTDPVQAASCNSKVVSVTVFADRALVTRSRRAELVPGENRVCFTELGTGIVEESIKAGIRSEGVTLAAAGLERETLWFYRENEHKAVWEEARSAVASLAELLDAKAVFSLESSLVAELADYLRQSLNAILLERDSSVARLREALAFVEGRERTTTGKLLELNRKYSEGEKALVRLREALRKIDNLDRKERCSIVLTIEAAAALEIDVEVSYIVPNASWRPVYDSFLDTETGKLGFKYFGAVRQATGEAWEDAAILLSTAAVQLSPEIPLVYPVYLSSTAQKRTKTIVVEGKDIQDLDASLPSEPEAVEPGALGGESDAGEEPVSGGEGAARKESVSTVFTVGEKATIPSDGSWHKVVILEREFPAETAYETVPELMEFVYLKASFANSTGLPFLAGSNSLYRNGSYVGRSPLAYAAPGERVNLSFGIDDDLRIRRIVLEDLYRPALGLIGKNSYGRTVKFALSNFKGREAKVLVREAVYLSELKEVSVRIDESSSPGWERDKEGIVSWTVAVKPDPVVPETRVLRYLVESGKSFDLGAVVGN
ncbi:MAG: mucoidy inhibitor MuiA family protein [Spirochaetes bacterium]|nr:mucoidy inhibitor MuiA family protein [Spirochaetota bacterium]